MNIGLKINGGNIWLLMLYSAEIERTWLRSSFDDPLEFWNFMKNCLLIILVSGPENRVYSTLWLRSPLEQVGLVVPEA